MDIRDAEPLDAAAMAAIYNHYVAQPAVTFEFEPVPPAIMAQRVADVQAAGLAWLVAVDGDAILAYASASSWKASRTAYRYAVETSVYVDPARTGEGIGVRLYAALIERLRERGIHAVIGGILLPNDASIVLHERLGFEKVAHFKEVGWKQSQWIDVGYWQLLV